MRKKSHISLTKYLIETVDRQEFIKHKRAFYIGSILPDCVPSFITRRHSFEKTFDILREEIRLLTEDYELEMGMNGYFCRHLGIVTHYIADYFTYPHNSVYSGSIKDHCYYEKILKYRLKEYVESEDAKRELDRSVSYMNVEEICEFIEKMHGIYLEGMKAIKEDIHYIVEICYQVVVAIINFADVRWGLENSSKLTFSYQV